VRNVTRNVDLGQKVRVAESLSSRAVGLLRTPRLMAGEGLWLTPCTSVHTWFMRYPIDILFIDADYRVLALQSLSPWRFSRWITKSHGVLELPSGMIVQTRTVVGDQIEFINVSDLPAGVN